MQEPQRIRPETLEALLNRASDPCRLGGHTRALRYLGRKFGQDFRTFKDLQDFLSSMLEEEAVALIAELGTRMPDLTKNTVITTVHRLPKAA